MVTLDIEDTCIRIMVVDGRKVEVAATLPLEPGFVEDGVVVDKEAVSQKLKELRIIYGVSEKQVVASISGIHSIYRVASIPRLPGKMLGEAAKREISRAMPVPLDELHTSWQAIAVSDVETVICMVGLPRNTVDALLETLQQAGFQSRTMDIKPLALAHVADEKDAIIINVQTVSFDIVVMMNGIPQLLRSLPFPSGDISVSDKVAVVKEEIDRTVAFYNSSHKGSSITGNIPVFVSGELADMLTEEAIGYQVKPLPVMLSYPSGFNAGEYAVNIGLALKQVKTAKSQVRVNINTVPEVYLPKPRAVIEVVSWAFVGVAITVLVPLAILTQQSLVRASTLQSQVNNAQLQMQFRQMTKVALDKLKIDLAKAKAAQDTFKKPLDGFSVQRAKVNGDLSRVTSLLPGTVNLNSVAYGKSFEISGTAPDEATILGYARALRDTNRFAQVIVSDMRKSEYNKWGFTLILK